MNEGTRTGILATALALSLVFNVFYIVGNWQARQGAAVEQASSSTPVDEGVEDRPDHLEDRADRERRLADRVAEQLSLTDEQRENFLELRMMILEEEKTFDQAMHDVRSEIDTELLSDQPDEARVIELRQRHEDLRRQRKMATFRYFSSFKKTLTEEQQKSFNDMLRSSHMDQFRRRFDQDHDGRLDAEEERKFKEACDRMRQGRQRGHRGKSGPPQRRDGDPTGGPDGPGGPRDLSGSSDRHRDRGGDGDCDSGTRDQRAPVENPELDPSEQARGPIFNA